MLIKIVLEPSEEGGYTAIALSLPGCISEGNSREDAINNIKEAIELYSNLLRMIRSSVEIQRSLNLRYDKDSRICRPIRLS